YWFHPCPPGTDLSVLWSRCRHCRRCLFRCSVFHASTFLPPLAPRALPRFCATTEALSPSGHGSSGLPQTMNAVPSPDRDPRFMSLQLLTILSPPTPCTPVLRSLSRRRPGRGVAVLPSRVGFRSGLHLTPSRVRQCIRPYRVHHFLFLWTGHSLRAAPHPVSRRRSCLQLRTASALSDGDFHPTVGAHSQAHEGRP